MGSEGMNLPQLQTALVRHFRSQSMRQKGVRAFERKVCDQRIENMRRAIPPEVVGMIRRSQSEPSGIGVLNLLRMPPRGTRRRTNATDEDGQKPVQVGIARPIVTEDLGTSDLYANWRPGRKAEAGAIVAVPLSMTTKKNIAGQVPDEKEIVILAQSYALRSMMEKIQLEDEVCDSVEAIIVDSPRYNERIATDENFFGEEKRRKSVGIAGGEIFDHEWSGMKSPMTTTGGFSAHKKAAEALENYTMSREVSLRSGSFKTLPEPGAPKTTFANRVDKIFRHHSKSQGLM